VGVSGRVCWVGQAWGAILGEAILVAIRKTKQAEIENEPHRTPGALMGPLMQWLEPGTRMQFPEQDQQRNLN
jgi:glycerol uptake facilitator-like aquaporin